MKTGHVFLIVFPMIIFLCFSVALAQLLAPTNLTATAVSSNQINLTWIDNNSAESGYSIERSLTPTSGFALVGTTAKNVATYSNTGLTGGTTYYYRVRATKSNENSPYSNIASARTLDTTPPTVSITSPASGATYTTAQAVTITASASDNVE